MLLNGANNQEMKQWATYEHKNESITTRLYGSQSDFLEGIKTCSSFKPCLYICWKTLIQLHQVTIGL